MDSNSVPRTVAAATRGQFQNTSARVPWMPINGSRTEALAMGTSATRPCEKRVAENERCAKSNMGAVKSELWQKGFIR